VLQTGHIKAPLPHFFCFDPLLNMKWSLLVLFQIVLGATVAHNTPSPTSQSTLTTPEVGPDVQDMTPPSIDPLCYYNSWSFAFDSTSQRHYAKAFCDLHGYKSLRPIASQGHYIQNTFTGADSSQNLLKYTFRISVKSGCSLGGTLNDYLEAYEELEWTHISPCEALMILLSSDYCDNGGVGGKVTFGPRRCASILWWAERSQKDAAKGRMLGL
jgi:hypothetical protein